MLGVNAWDEPKDEIVEFVNEKGLKHRILLDGSTVHTQYGTRNIPALVWINRQGVVLEAELGFDGQESLHKKTKKLINSAG